MLALSLFISKTYMQADSNPLTKDEDGDGIAEIWDKCPNTPAGVSVDKDGCSVLQSQDHGLWYMDENGILRPINTFKDSDGDKIPDHRDRCPSLGLLQTGEVSISGCPYITGDPSSWTYTLPSYPTPYDPRNFDSDNDGIADADDRCPDTAPGEIVDFEGCPIPL